LTIGREPEASIARHAIEHKKALLREKIASSIRLCEAYHSPVSALLLAFLLYLMVSQQWRIERLRLRVPCCEGRCWIRPSNLLSASGLSLLPSIAELAPVNPFTTRRHIMYTFFDISHLSLGLSFLCSAISVGIATHSLVVVAINREAFEAIRPIWDNAIMVNFSCKLTFMQVCLLKQRILEIFLDCECEVTIFDADVVFLKNPCVFFMKQIAGHDFAFQHDHDVVPISFEPNIGVYTIAPSNSTHKVFRVWKSNLHSIDPAKYRVATDQYILRDILSSGRVTHTPLSDCFVMTGLRNTFVEKPISVRFFNGLDMTSYYHVSRMKDERAIQLMNTTPCVMHLSCLAGLHSKLVFMRCAGYSFVDPKNQCSNHPRSVTFWNLFDSARLKECRPR
jgi:hypothetical protein